jgi:hypothetical protein
MVRIMRKDFLDFDIPDDFEPEKLLWQGHKGIVMFKKKKRKRC